MVRQNKDVVNPSIDDTDQHSLEITAATIAHWLSVLTEPDGYVELRAIQDCKPRRKVESHPYRNRDGQLALMAQDALEAQRWADGVYWTLNPTSEAPSLEKRPAKDSDVVRRRWILFDFDPVRQVEPGDSKHCSATDGEKQAAKQAATRAHAFLEEQGWPEPIVADSGNGYHLLYRIDLPADDGGLVRRVLHGLAHQVDTELVTVDRSVYNPSRICKLYGTISRKGPNSAERPHRVSKVLKLPPALDQVVTTEQLEAVAVAEDPDRAMRERREAVAIQPVETATPEAEGRVEESDLFPKSVLPKRLRAKAKKQLDRGERGELYADHCPPAISGKDGHIQTFKLAVAIGPGLDNSPAETFRILKERYNPRCEPRWSDDELRHKVDDAFKKESQRGWLLKTDQVESEKKQPAKPSSNQVDELKPIVADNDPHRLARVFMEEFDQGSGLVTHCDEIWRYQRTHFVRFFDVKTDLVASVKAEFDRLNIAAQQRIRERMGSQASTIEMPFTQKVTPNCINSVLQALRSETAIPWEVAPPCWLGSNTEDLPSPENLVACGNGLLDIGKGALYPHTADYFNPFPAIPFDYDPAAPYPARWQKFIESVWPNDPQLWRELQKWFGYLLTPDTRQQKILVMIGPTRSGKGTISRLLEKLLGKHNIASLSLAGLSGPFGLSPLVGKSVAIFPDAKFHGRTAEASIAVERLVSISGEDTQSVSRKYEDDAAMRLRTRFVMFCNELPNLRDNSTALARRLIPFQMTQSFLGKEDKKLDAKLESEIAGILNWAIDGLNMLRADEKFIVPDSCLELLDSVIETTSPITAFIKDCLRVDPAIPDENHPTTQAVIAAYREWCDERGERAQDERIFSRNLRAASSGIESYRPRRQGERVRYLRGVELSEHGESLRKQHELQCVVSGAKNRAGTY